MSKRSDDQRKAMFAKLNKGSVGKKKSGRLKRAKRLDTRSKKAIAIDKGKIAKHRFNPLQVEEWKKVKSTADLMGYDAVVNDPRSKRAIAIDRGKEAEHVIQLDNKKGYARWKKNRGKMDLQSWDTHLRPIRKKIKAEQRKIVKLKREAEKRAVEKAKVKGVKRKRKSRVSTKISSRQRSGIRRYVKRCIGSSDILDVDALIDSRLTYAENKRIIQSVIKPTMRDIFPH